ncbi:FAD:protein FMN transferase [Nocardia macrotermitis]|uniref:FAD:protein FMN transferase n=1 Tax=Nocardia macrotermitis TaxID=2585198 RepID=A0A7K0D5Q6_9NOCA|nr:FAD:protein FMN transferase [Nocardia macrotermitis]MQY21060.1 FAD:protein FMN transferase [Nocardia macrotermitis]
MTPRTLDDRTAAADWEVWSTRARLVVTDPAQLVAAQRTMREYLDAADRACSRFRDDSELNGLTARHGRPAVVGPLLAEYLRAALAVAEQTAGDVDPTVGAALVRLGYDRDFGLLAGTDTPAPPQVVIARRPDYRAILLHQQTVTVPREVRLDLGATAKAVAADRCADLIAERFGCGVLVSLGGDIATAGSAPEGGWQIEVRDGPNEPGCRISLPAGAAMATSSTIRRRWKRGGHLVHHIVDPRTGVAAETVWRTVSVAADTCLTANAAATAAIVRGHDALGPLRRSGLPARLVDRGGRVGTVGAWPAER